MSKRNPSPDRDNERNQYIPSFIANKPFYVPDDAGNDYLEHQRLQKKEQDSRWYDRGKKAPVARKYRKGACENCGSMTHKAKECLSRPRKAGAKWTNENIQADDTIEDLSLGWDAKRDRWNGFDASEYDKVLQQYNEMEKMKNESARELDDDKYEEEADMGRKQSTSTRNLRLREDTAKYLLNLEVDSTEYDPKARKLVDSGKVDAAAKLLDEENFVKKGGDAAVFERAQRYAWERQEQGVKVHLQANPTAGELYLKKAQKEEEERKAKQKKALLDKYGSQADVQNTALKQLMVTESDSFVEYDASGAIKGAPKIKPKSKYPEDVFPGNHSSVWGSWWSDFTWGYACCHSTAKNSYCTGKAGIEAFEQEKKFRLGIEASPAKEAAQEDRAQSPPQATRKRTLAEITGDEITEQEMDEYRKKRVNAHDPMAGLLDKKDLLD